VATVGIKAMKNLTNSDKWLPPFKSIVTMNTDTIAEMITGMPRFPSNPKACPVDLARGLVSV